MAAAVGAAVAVEKTKSKFWDLLAKPEKLSKLVVRSEYGY
jgi:hypothetical protein